MSNSLRFTPDEFHSLRDACRSLSFIGPYTKFQRDLAAELRSQYLPLAKRVGRLSQRQIRTLRTHMERQSQTAVSSSGSDWR